LPASALKVSVAGILPIIKSLPNEAELGCDNVLWYKSSPCAGACKHVFFYVDKSNACDVEKVKTEPEEVEDKEFKEDKKSISSL
jgi:hypothetical protein